ncbi:MAG: 3-deoxy-manno-octulosonate cytidylyltransferase [Nitrospirales bacterium]|nr:3-deoxy-manno-octulosonate cytidylyltransferase [Nitrospira sp.]MDR4502766.1 3-deoxy-manno-octulosonate cytidylyltransferase [Nitrospirales bacterium]
MPHDVSSIAVLIPARYGSSRFPGKPLALLDGRPLIQHVYEAAARTSGVSDVRVVTDDERIVRAVRAFGGLVMIVDAPCRTGTDRIAKAAEQVDCPIIVNLQADEIPLHSELLRDLIDPFVAHEGAGMGTLKRRITAQQELEDTALVKVVTDANDQAVYFSRLPIPYVRDTHTEPLRAFTYYSHLGIYIFRRSTLFQFARLPTGSLEDAEKLEQLRALEHGLSIHVWETKRPSLRIDRPEELESASAHYEKYSKPTVRSLATELTS